MFKLRTIDAAKAACAGMVMAVLAATPSIAADTCASTADAEAFAMRDLQSRLMVAGLACGQREAYNAFVKGHQSVLARTGARLKDYFLTRADGVQALDRHVTRVANVAARTHGRERDAFCAETAVLFKQLVEADRQALVRAARQFGFRSVQKPQVCSADASPAPAKTVTAE